MREKTVSKLLGLSALAVIGASLMIGGCGSEPGIVLQPTPFIGLATPTPTPEFVFTANFGVGAGSLSSLAVAFEALSPANLLETETTKDADNISVLSLQPVALTIENNENNFEAYAIDPNFGTLSFLVDNTNVVNTAFGDSGNTAFRIVTTQAVIGANTLAYTFDEPSGSLGAFDVQESGVGEGTMSQTAFSTGTGLSPQTIDLDLTESLQVVSSGFSNTFLISGETTFSTDDAEVESWGLNADGSFNQNFTGSAGFFDLNGDGGTTDNGAVTGQTSFNNGTAAFLVVTGNSADQFNLFSIEMDNDGDLFEPTPGNGEFASLNITDANNAFPVGVVVQTVGTQLTAEVTLADGAIVPVPINADGTFGTAGTPVVPPTNEVLDATGASSVIPSAADPNLFFLIVQTSQTGNPDFVVPVSTASGAAVFGVAQPTGSTGATGGDVSALFFADGGDAHFGPTAHKHPHRHHH